MHVGGGLEKLDMKVRYQADADLDKRIVRAVRRQEPSIDFQFASGARLGQGLAGLLDDDVLSRANALTARYRRACFARRSMARETRLTTLNAPSCLSDSR
jgi:hypothetical protein